MAILNKPQRLTKEQQDAAMEIIRKYDVMIRKIAAAYLGRERRSEVEDVVQDVYEAICRQIEDVKRYESMEALVVRITVRRTWKVRKKLQGFVPLDEVSAKPSENVDPGLDEILPASTPQADRDILSRIYVQRDTAEEAAKDLGINAGTVRQRLKRARDRLRKILMK